MPKPPLQPHPLHPGALPPIILSQVTLELAHVPFARDMGLTLVTVEAESGGGHALRGHSPGPLSGATLEGRALGHASGPRTWAIAVQNGVTVMASRTLNVSRRQYSLAAQRVTIHTALRPPLEPGLPAVRAGGPVDGRPGTRLNSPGAARRRPGGRRTQWCGTVR